MLQAKSLKSQIKNQSHIDVLTYLMSVFRAKTIENPILGQKDTCNKPFFFPFLFFFDCSQVVPLRPNQVKYRLTIPCIHS